MGFFDMFKKKKQEPDVFSGQGMVNYIKENLADPSDENVLEVMQEIVKPDSDQEHLTPEGRLPWGWLYANKDFTDKISGEHSYFHNRLMEASKSSPKDKYEALKDYVTYINDAQKLCHSKGECFAYWFDGCVADNDYVEKKSAELKELEANVEQLQKEYETKQSALENLEQKVWDKLKANEGMLQADFLKLFDKCIKHEVSSLLYEWGKSGKIKREKSGRSYELYIK